MFQGKLNEWKRVYKTTQALVAICNLSRPLYQTLNGNNTDPIDSSIVGKSSVSDLQATSMSFWTHRSSERNTTSQVSQMSSLYSVQANDHKQNLFKRIFTSHYGPKFDYLVSAFENTVNLKESVQVNDTYKVQIFNKLILTITIQFNILKILD